MFQIFQSKRGSKKNASDDVVDNKPDEDDNLSARSDIGYEDSESGFVAIGDEDTATLHHTDKNEKSVRKRTRSPPQTVDKDAEERNQRGNLINIWKEKVQSDATRGIPTENLSDYITYLGDALAIKDGSVVKNFKETIQEL